MPICRRHCSRLRIGSVDNGRLGRHTTRAEGEGTVSIFLGLDVQCRRPFEEVIWFKRYAKMLDGHSDDCHMTDARGQNGDEYNGKGGNA